MGEINVTLMDLTNAAARFNSAATKCDELRERLNTTTNSMMDQWKGNSKTAFQHEYEILYKNMNTYKQVLIDIAAELNEIAKGFEETDADLNKQILGSINSK